MAKLNEDVKVVMLKGEKGEKGEAGTGIPTGGKTGQAIIKASDNDYDYKWGSLVVNDVANATNDGNGNNIVNTYATKTDVSTNYLTKTDASNTYATKTDVSTNYLTKTDASNTYATKAELANAANFDKIYPVGSIYMSVNSTNPSLLFGGTWELLKDRFLLGAGGTYGVGATGGEAEHTLTIAEMPAHRHYMIANIGGNTHMAIATGSGSYNTNGRTTEEGNDQPHNNMPPYLAVYMWKRTA